MLLRERLEYSLLCMKIGAVLESADNSVRKDKGRYFVFSRILHVECIKRCDLLT